MQFAFLLSRMLNNEHHNTIALFKRTYINYCISCFELHSFARSNSSLNLQTQLQNYNCFVLLCNNQHLQKTHRYPSILKVQEIAVTIIEDFKCTAFQNFMI